LGHGHGFALAESAFLVIFEILTKDNTLYRTVKPCYSSKAYAIGVAPSPA